MVFTTHGLIEVFEIATESWHKWDLNPRFLEAATKDILKK